MAEKAVTIRTRKFLFFIRSVSLSKTTHPYHTTTLLVSSEIPSLTSKDIENGRW
jgi:hypothetical protein